MILLIYNNIFLINEFKPCIYNQYLTNILFIFLINIFNQHIYIYIFNQFALKKVAIKV